MSNKTEVAKNDLIQYINNLRKSVIVNHNNYQGYLDWEELSKNIEILVSTIEKNTKTLSSIDYNYIYNYFNENKNLNILVPYSLKNISILYIKTITLTKDLVKSIISDLNNVTLSIGLISQSNNESKRKHFIDAIITNCVALFLSSIYNDSESSINYSNFTGRVEYVLKTVRDNIILVVIEAKQDIEYIKNYGQIMSELYCSYNINILKDKKLDYIYGILTTGESWQLWKFDGNQYYCTSRNSLLFLDDDRSIPILVSNILSIILESWSNYINKYQNVDKIVFNNIIQNIFIEKDINNQTNNINELKKFILNNNLQLIKNEDLYNITDEYL